MQMIALLEALLARPQEWRHGYDLMKDTGLSSGTLYPLLMRMTDRGLVSAEWRAPAQHGRPSRHVYRLTTTGRALAREVREDKPVPSYKASLA